LTWISLDFHVLNSYLLKTDIMNKIPGKVIFIFLIAFPLLSYTTTNESNREISTGGFHFVEDAGRTVFNFNVGWRFFKGPVPDAENPAYEDHNWEIVNLPHGLELLPDEASGSINYQGEAWYRKKFSVPQELEGRKVYLNFEAIMGKSKVWINGKLAGENFGGYLPLIIDATDFLHYGTTKNCIAVLTDNSDDELYPPGRSQKLLDFSYFGGIYRDVWLISMDQLHITNPNYVDKIAGGGVFVHYENLTKDKVTVVVKTDVQNESGLIREFRLETIIKDVKGNVAGQANEQIELGPYSSVEINQEIEVNSPDLWSPETPYLYNLFSLVKEGNAKVTDGFRTRIGIRKIEFLGKKGFYLNNEPYEGKLMGANRHQDFGYVGNAVSNSMHWRDVKKLKEAGVNVIRTAHYPQDPAFMDACDELGVFYIEATPGWQFWNDDPVFVNRAYSDIRNMIRRIRNRPCVLLWEPILNEARYPDEFAKRAVEITKEEYPFQGCFTACDAQRESSKYFDVLYSHTYAFRDMHTRYLKNNKENQERYALDYSQTDKCFFTREWGDCADNFRAQNSPSRVHRSWGETPQLIQALHYAYPDYLYTSYNNICLTPRQHVGGSLWHSFDHQRGYFPDTFYGGIMDIFRQPKYSYYMFMSQQKPGTIVDDKVVEPMVYIVNEMTPFSSSDVVVFSNCDAVYLTVLGEPVDTIVTRNETGMPYFPAIFKDAYRFYDLKARFRTGDNDGVEILAEGVIDGKVVVSTVKKPSMRPAKIQLEADYSGRSLVADGSDFLVVIASITDDEGNVKRLNNKQIIFEVAGEGELIGDVSIGANPRKIEWGTAPALIRATTKPGTIIVKAKLDERYFHTALEATIEIVTVPPPFKLLYDESELQITISHEKGKNAQVESETITNLKKQLQETQYELNKLNLQKVEKEQESIEEGPK
jgi:beta-galactosidase